MGTISITATIPHPTHDATGNDAYGVRPRRPVRDEGWQRPASPGTAEEARVAARVVGFGGGLGITIGREE